LVIFPSFHCGQMSRQTLGCCTPTYSGEIWDESKLLFSCTFRAAGWSFPMLLFNHMFCIFFRLFPVLAAFVAIAGTGVIRTGLWLGIIVWWAHRFISV